MKILHKKNGLSLFLSSILFFAILFLLLNKYSAILLCPDGYREGSDCYVSWWHNIEIGQILVSLIFGPVLAYFLVYKKK
jgi:hypothetical protein